MGCTSGAIAGDLWLSAFGLVPLCQLPGTDPLGAHLDYFRIADYSEFIIELGSAQPLLRTTRRLCLHYESDELQKTLKTLM
jgi:hypothetical protein